MDFLGGMSEISEASEIKDSSGSEISQESLEKFDKIMGDDKIESQQPEEAPELTPVEAEHKFSKLFDVGDFFKKSEVNSMQNNVENNETTSNDATESEKQKPDISEKREPNSEYEIDGDVYETDDNGDTYKKNGELLPNKEYTVNGNKYRTDEHGNKISCDSEPSYTEDGTRNTKEQKESGGEERQEDDDGGHIIAKILGGAEGEENLVPMRRTINRGDYKKMENEISKALQEGKKVTVHIDLEYEEDSGRPSKIRAEYTIDGKKTVVEFDNKENSTELLDSLNEKISDEDYNNLKEELADMKADGIEGSVTSVKVEYDEEENPTRVTVGVLDESTGKKSYKVYEPR
jgi:hypothetical protein